MQGLFGFGVHGRWFLILVMLLGITPLSQAADLGRTFIVDPLALDEEDHDHDYVFKTLDALLGEGQIPRPAFNDTIILKAGDHVGSFVLDEDGVIFRGEYGQDQTWLRGSLTITASQVTVEGVSIDATGLDYGLSVEDDDVVLTNINARLAEVAGIRLNRASRIHLSQVEAINNGSAGVLLEDSDRIYISDSLFQSNGADGVAIVGSSDVNISNSTLNLNNSYGLRMETADHVQLTNSTLNANDLHGVWAVDSGQTTIMENFLSGNGGFGVGLEASSKFIISNNSFSDNGGLTSYSGGVLFGHDSLENTVIGNEFVAHSNQQGAGVWLIGTASTNRIIENSFSQNHIGVGLDNDDDDLPQENFVYDNDILGSQSGGIWSNGQDNEYVMNTITNGNGPGIQLTDTEGESVRENTITGNSHAGVLARRTTQLVVEDNTINGNGSGVWGNQLNRSDILNNTISANFGAGVHAAQSELLEIYGNVLNDNTGIGIRLEETSQVDVTHNQVNESRNLGMLAVAVTKVDVQNNRFASNDGGLKIEASNDITLRLNDVMDNQGYGLEVLESEEIDAAKNYWGRRDGPSGIAPSTPSGADGVSGLHMHHVFPWLTQPVEDVDSRSVIGWYFDIQPQDHRLSAPSLDIALGISGMQAERGWITAYRRTDPFSNAEAMEITQHFAVTTGGTISGEMDIVLLVDTDALPEGLSLEALRLYHWTPSGWEVVPSLIEDTAATLRGSIMVDGSEDFLFVLGWEAEEGV